MPVGLCGQETLTHIDYNTRIESFKRTIKLVDFSQFLKCFNHKSHLRVYFLYVGIGLCLCVRVCVCMGSCKCWFEPCCPCLFNIVLSL